MERSPYGANAEELIATVFSEALGYVSVRQDMRGTHQSEGVFGCWHDSANDAYDTMAWIVQQTWSNGEVFTTGASASIGERRAGTLYTTHKFKPQPPPPLPSSSPTLSLHYS
jgi:alpha/beta superfamily hydrolase